MLICTYFLVFMSLFKKRRVQIFSNKAFQGEMYLLVEVIMWSLFPIFSILAISLIAPLYTAALSTLIAALFFGFVLTVRKQWGEIKVKSAWKDIVMMTFIIGVIFYSLVFIGLQKTTAGNASIILLMEVFFTMFILGLWKKEKIVLKHKLGAVLMVVGALFVLFPGQLKINEGDLILLIATAVPPVGNYFSQRARKKVGSNMIMFIRSLLAGLFILLLAFAFESTPTMAAITESTIFILVNGILLMGLSKVFWIEAIHRISITKAISLASVTPAFTLVFAYFMLGEIPTIWQILGFLPMLIGIFILTEFKFKHLA